MLLCAVVAFAACEQIYVDVVSDIAAGDRCLSVSFEGEDTRIQLNEAQKTVWTEGDILSVFYRSTVNEEWQFKGKTGDRTGDIVPVDNTLNPPYTHNRVVVIYPYNENYYLNTETYSIEASLPAVQNYLKDSYGTNGNIMVSSSDYKQVSLKSVCGWLKLQLTGSGEVVKSITLRGNNGEQVAGELYINTSTATATLASASGDAGENEVGGTLVRPGTILKEVTLDCGEGVTLGAEATAFYIALPPQTFENGFKVEIVCADDTKMVKSSNKALSIERNHIQPMTAMEFTPSVPNNQIWYTSYYGDIVEPNNTNVFGANIVSNTYTNGKGVITFDGDVTTIGYETFAGCYSLTSVTIPDSVTTIGTEAFDWCTSLTSVTIPDSVTTIGDVAFYYCTSLTSVTIGDSVTTIGYGAFTNCTSLTSVTIGDSVTTIGDYAFDGCYCLTSVTIGDSVTVESVAEALRYCRSLQEFKGKFASEDGRCLIDDGVLYYVAPSGLTAYTIPDSVTEIGGDAFYYCTSLTSVTIPDSVTEIGWFAFEGCTSLTSVTIPDSVTEIGRGAFHSCTSLTSVTIPDSVTATGERTFCNCTSLTSVNIPDSITWIGEGAFSACTSLTSVNIPDSVTGIGGCAFSGCTSLTSVTIPDSVTTIGWYAFSDCTSLTSVYCKAATPPSLGTDVFVYNASGRKIYVPASSASTYRSATNWSEYKSAIVGYDF